jgi:cell division protein FtsA
VVTKDIKDGCSILNRQAESLKIMYGSALGDLAQEDKIVTIPGISGRDSKEISFKSLAYIIQSRMEEIIDAIMYEIDISGGLEKLSAGIVFTGGGALLRHLPQLVKFHTGLDVRIGYPVEQLATESIPDVNQPMYSTSIGLLLKGYDFRQKQKEPKPNDDAGTGKPGGNQPGGNQSGGDKPKSNIMEVLFEKFFRDNSPTWTENEQKEENDKKDEDEKKDDDEGKNENKRKDENARTRRTHKF